MTGGLLAVLLATGGQFPAEATSPPSPLLAQVTPGSVTGRLDENSEILDDGSYFNSHTFTGRANESIRIKMESEDFDAYLILVGPNGETVAENDDEDGSTNAQIVVTLPAAGTYQIIANAYAAGATGQYALTWRSVTTAEVTQYEALQDANRLNQQALELYRAGRYAEAEALIRESLAILREQLGADHPDVATSLNNLAALYRVQGRYGEAEPFHQQSLTIRREQLGADHPAVATSLNNLAALYQDQGRYVEAEPLYQESLAIRREQLGVDHPDVAISLNNLASLYQAQGRYGEAEPLYQQSLAILREQLGADHPDVANSLNNLAELYRVQGRYGEAEPLYQESLAIWREQLGTDHPDVATSLSNLASLYQVQGRYGEAEPLYQESLAIWREQLGADHPDVATSLNNLAELYRDQGRYGEAESLYQQSLAIWREQLGTDHPDVATSLSNLASLYQAQGNWSQAMHYLQSGLAIEEVNLEQNLGTLTETQRQDYAATLLGSTDATIALSLQAATDVPDALPLGLTTLLRRKGRLLESGTASRQRLRQNLTPADQATLDDLIGVQQQLATLTFNPPPNLPPEDYRAQLEQLESKATDLEKTLAQRSAVFRAETEPVEIATVQAQLPAQSVLVEYARYRPFDAKADLANQWSAPRYAAYLLFPDGRIEAVDLGDAAEIDAAVQAFINLLQDRNTALQRATLDRVADPTVTERTTQTIKTLVFDPIAPYLQGTEHLLISPDGQLNRLPFEALQPEAGGEYLVQQYQISYLNSGRDLLKFDLIEPSQNPAVILANPDYDVANFDAAPFDAAPFDTAQGASELVTERSLSGAETNRRSADLSQIRVGRLPGTAAEAAAIRPLLPNATLLTADAATENALKQVNAPRILHIATHGFFLPDTERVIAPNQLGGGAIATPISVPVENPLLRSGLALAGFNPRRSGHEDGVLTALEASQLNLFGTQLVVLSACETGLGDITNGEGVYGLRRAFALAGAETQLMSLWQVSDDGTQRLMTRYYENLMAGMGRSDALRAVQLEAIEAGAEYSHPYYWSAFILAGDWRSLAL